jgi:NAD(P)-dependent dehydrogenase (short-subunit alcohol dehydrogenase family)
LGTPDGATLLAKEVRSIVGERLDVLVSNAGISKAATIKDHTVEDFDNLFATNVRSPFFLVQGSPVWTTLRSLPTPRPKEH